VHRFLLLLTAASTFGAAVDYAIVYVRAPRYGDSTNTRWPEVINAVQMEPGADLVLLHPNGSEEVLYAGGNGSVVDPAVSLNGEWVYFSYFPDLRQESLNYQRNNAPRAGADIYKINVRTRQVVRLTTQTWKPPSGASKWSTNHLTASSPDAYYLGYGIFNLGPCPLPGGKVMFTSSRDGYLPNKGMTFPNLRLYVMDEDGRNVEPIGHLNIGSALHPTVLKDGRVMFSSYESQGLRDSRVWGLWSIWPDGRQWEPLFSAFVAAGALHFQTQLSDGRIGVIEYYNLNNNGFGTLLAFDSQKDPSRPPFGDPNPSHSTNPAVRRGIWYFDPSHPAHLQPRYKQYGFSPPGLVALTGFTHGEDEASSRALDGSYAGKVTHPSGAPANDVLLVYSPGPANSLSRPTSTPYYDGGIYILRGGVPVNDHRQLVLVKNDPRYNEMQPRAVVPYAAIYGAAEPARIPYLPNDGSLHAALPPGTPFGLIGTSSFYKRNTSPGWTRTNRFNGLDPFNTQENDANSNWFTQGSDAGRFTNADIHAVRIVATEAAAHRSYGPGMGHGRFLGFRNHADAERLRIIGEIPLRKPGVIDPDGNPDTSFLAKIPADTPFTFQLLDRDGLALSIAQTWHMVRPGEVRTDCGGCHAHSQVGTEFSQTAAGRGAVPVVDLTASRPVDVEYYRDIKPILQRSCVACHSKTGRQEAGLVLDDTTLISGYEGTWHRIAEDQQAQWGIPPVIPIRTWRQTNASRYVRMFQSRRSLLMWKIMGRRLDGWSNSDFPTETTPGNPATLPSGANPSDADLDFTGTIMPPAGSGLPALTDEEKRLFARWIDLGCPISSQDAVLSKMGWFTDDVKPVLTVSSPRAGQNGPLARFVIGMFDGLSGLDRASLSVVANFDVNGKPAGTELGPDFRETDRSVYSLDIASPIRSLPDGLLTVKVKDRQGNYSDVALSFSVGEPGGGGGPVEVTPGSAALTPGRTQQFSANMAVTWSISPSTGSISSAGMYTAPGTITSAQRVTVTAKSVADASQSDTATIDLQPPPVALNVTPSAATLTAGKTQQFSANMAVTWSISPSTGSISSAGMYTAPGTITSAQRVTVTAKSVADASQSDTATIDLQAPATVLTITPASVSLRPGMTQQFSANLPVGWSISPAAGSISPGGLYTAPATITTPQRVTVTAKSTADAAKTASATIDLQPPGGQLTVLPRMLVLGPSQSWLFRANAPVTWSLSPAVGSISSSGRYTAPANITSEQKVTVKATSTADPTRWATATITLQPAGLRVFPTAATVLAGKSIQFRATVPVSWSIAPALGTISSSGLYTAPPVVQDGAKVTVTATAANGTDGKATAVVTLD
jgi:hypothetical protein